MSRRLRAVVLLAAWPLGACYSYQTIRTEELAPGTEVRVRVTPEEGARVSEIVGYPTRDVQGKLDQVSPDALLVTVPGQTADYGASSRRFYQRVDIPVAQVIEVEQRRLNRGKTYLFFGGIAAAAVAVLATQLIDIGGKNDGGGKGGPENVLVPLLRLR